MRLTIVSLAAMAICFLASNVFSDSQPDVKIEVTRLEEIDQKTEEFIRKINNSVQEIQPAKSVPSLATNMDIKINYSVREPKVSNLDPKISHSLDELKIKGVTDFESQFNNSIASSFNR